MNGKKAKWLNKLVETRNPVLLLMIRNKYGKSTQRMGYAQLYSKAKQLYKKGFFRDVKGWPTIHEMRKMKREVVFDESLTGTGSTE